MTTKQSREKLLQVIASDFEIDPTKLKLWLRQVSNIYKEKTLEYNAVPNQKEHKDSCKAIANKSRDLIKQLDAAPHIKAYIDTHPQLPAIADLTHTLALLREAAETLELNRLDGEGNKSSSKPEFHRNHLILDLAATWQELTGKDHSYSTEFERFIELACDYMEIDWKGLWRKYTALRSADKI